jgi:tetratricopeptide (TPR) repeat protein
LERRLQKAQELLNTINRKIDLGFYVKFRAALDLAVNAFTMSKAENRRSSALAAINLFLEAEHIYTDFVDVELAQKSQIVDEYLLTLSLAYIAEARCYLELGEWDTALRRFQEGSEKIHSRIVQYVELLLTSNPAAYLHPRFKRKISLQRLTKIYQWLDPSLDENAVFELQRDNLFSLARDQSIDSSYKWVNSLPSAIVASAEVKGSIFGNREEVKQEAMKRLPQVFETMESMIETNYRFESYQTEVKAIAQLDISFHDWLRLSPVEPQPEAASLMLIVPSQPLELL